MNRIWIVIVLSIVVINNKPALAEIYETAIVAKLIPITKDGIGEGLPSIRGRVAIDDKLDSCKVFLHLGGRDYQEFDCTRGVERSTHRWLNHTYLSGNLSFETFRALVKAILSYHDREPYDFKEVGISDGPKAVLRRPANSKELIPFFKFKQRKKGVWCGKAKVIGIANKEEYFYLSDKGPHDRKYDLAIILGQENLYLTRMTNSNASKQEVEVFEIGNYDILHH